MSKQTAKKPFLGIIVAANTRQEAEKEFVSVATGKSVLSLADETGTFEFLTSSESSGMMNPMTGALDLVETESSDLEFVSSSSDELKAEYTICADGCGSHIISESDSAVKHCPRCSSELRSLSEEEIEALSADTLDDEDFDADIGGIVVAGDTLEGALQEYIELSASKAEGKFLKTSEDETFMTSASCELKFNPFNGDESLSVSEAPEEFELTASDEDGSSEANYFICANDECEKRHVVSTSADVIICPSCSCGLIEPEDNDGDSVLNVTASLDQEDEIEETESTEAAADEETETAVEEESESSSETVELEDAEVSESGKEEEEMGNGIIAVSSDLETALEEFITLASSEGTDENLEAQYKVCSNAECDKNHVVSEEGLSECPSCSGSLEEPKEYGEDEVLRVTASLDNEEVEEATESESAGCSKKKYSKSEDDEDEDDEDMDDEDLEDEDDEEEDEDEEEDYEDEDEDEDDEEEEDEDSDSDLSVSSESDSADDVEKETLSVSALEIAESSNALDPNRLFVCFAGSIEGVPTWLALCDNIHVASANPVSAKAHADLFQSEKFGQAVMATAKEHGVEFALREMGFEVVSHDLEVDSLVNRKIDKEVTDKVIEVQASAQEELDSISERYHAALSTAFVGINKSVWKGLNNPIKDALVSSLSSAGMRNPDLVVDRVFENHSESYIKSAMEKANSLMNLTLPAQNEISEMVKDSNHRSTSGSVEQRLSSIASDVETDKTDEVEDEVTQSTSSDKGNYNAKLVSVLGNLGKRRQ